MAKSLTVRLCEAISKTIETHPDPIDNEEIIGSLLATVGAYSLNRIGVIMTLQMLAAQMMVAAGRNGKLVQEAIDNVKIASELQNHGASALLGLGFPKG